MKELSLFTGGGGGLLASILLGWRTVGAVEWEEYPCKVLEQRQKDNMLDDFPIFNMDIREFNRRIAPAYTGLVDVVSAGFPCQPFSVAGKREGADDERNMWPATIECVRIVRPRFVFLENVPGLINSGYFDTILGDLAQGGYDARWRVLSAAELGAPHRRNRLWIVGLCRQHSERQPTKLEPSARVGISTASPAGEAVANTEPSRRNGEAGAQRPGRGSESANGRELGHAVNTGLEERESQRGNTCQKQPTAIRSGGQGVEWWAVEPQLDRVAYGVADRVDRLKALGNGQVPAVAATAWRLLTEAS